MITGAVKYQGKGAYVLSTDRPLNILHFWRFYTCFFIISNLIHSFPAAKTTAVWKRPLLLGFVSRSTPYLVFYCVGVLIISGYIIGRSKTFCCLKGRGPLKKVTKSAENGEEYQAYRLILLTPPLPFTGHLIKVLKNLLKNCWRKYINSYNKLILLPPLFSASFLANHGSQKCHLFANVEFPDRGRSRRLFQLLDQETKS